mgnify:CR=1 FL=1
MKVASLQFNPICENTYVVWDDTNECIVVDAGNSDERENARLKEFIDSRGLHPRMAVNTHGHFDHTLGVQFLKDTYGIPFALSGKDKFLLDNAAPGSSIFGVKVGAMPSIDLDLDTTDEVRFGHTALKIIPTPGHTPGHVSLYAPQAKAVFTGDTLFRESIGRTDLPGGDYSWIMRSILDSLLPLGEEVHVYPGHGPETTIGHETLYNPFIVEVLNDEVALAKQNKEWRREYMTLLMRDQENIDKGREQGLEEGRKEGLQEGLKQGIEQGEGRITELMQKLLQDKRYTDMEKVISAPRYRQKLYEEYHVL